MDAYAENPGEPQQLVDAIGQRDGLSRGAPIDLVSGKNPGRGSWDTNRCSGPQEAVFCMRDWHRPSIPRGFFAAGRSLASRGALV